MKTHSLPLDKHNHVALHDAATDPYGNLEYAVGSSEDFHCFDYAIFQHEGIPYLVIHAAVNSETGSFIQDLSYTVVDLYGENWEGEALLCAANAVADALAWCAENGVRHTRAGWSQDPYYFVRAVARALYRHGVESEEIASLSRDSNAFRYGSAKLNRVIEALCPRLAGCLPVSRRPPQRLISTYEHGKIS